MSRSLGATDKVIRRRRTKTRSDAGKKRSTYRGIPCKHHKPSYYKRRIGNKGSIKIRPLFRVPMSRDGYNNWNKTHWLKAKLWKEVTDMKLSPSFRVDTDEINTKAKIEQWVADNKWEGKFVIMGISSAKTKTHRKWVKMCTIIVKETPEGRIGKMIENKRMSKYSWFYKN